MGHRFMQYLRQRKQIKESGYFPREFNLDIKLTIEVASLSDL